MRANILIVDDEQDMLMLLQRILSENTENQLTLADDSRKARRLLQEKTFDVLITDLKMPNVSGMELLEYSKEHCPMTAVIMMTAHGCIDSAIEATRKGAFDYVTKPFRKERILQIVDQALKWQGMELENKILRERLGSENQAPTMIGNSPAMAALQRQVSKVAATSATVLVTGESGTGKELVAKTIHLRSKRSSRPIVPVNCGAMPESLMESELFGHVRGAFTGAIKDKPGLVGEAAGGTLFLDEIGDISLAMQVKLLRLLQEGEYKCVGDTRNRKADVRFIAATHQDLPERIRKGEFREDLFYRLNVINIQIPPLRERREDIPALANYFFKKYVLLHEKRDLGGISPEAMDTLCRADWPGNIRELENVLERGVILATRGLLQPQDLALQNPAHVDAGLMPGDEYFQLPFKDAKDKLLDQFQTTYLSKVLSRHGGNVSHAARDSGLKRQYFHKLMRELDVQSSRFKNGGQ